MNKHRMVENILLWFLALGASAVLVVAVENLELLDAAMTELLKWVIG